MKKYLLIALSLLIIQSLKPQTASNFLQVDVGGGLHSLSYTLLNGTRKDQVGMTADLAFSHYFTKNWGILTGVGMHSYAAISVLNFTESTPDLDADADLYEFRTAFRDWQEKQQAIFVDIPLSIQYKLELNKSVAMLVSTGGRISLPISGSYGTVGGEMETTGYYSAWNVELSNMPQHGFSTVTASQKGSFTLKTAYTIDASLGALFQISKKLFLYIGAYGDLGLNNPLTPNTLNINGVDGTYHGVFESNQTSTIKPLAIGLKTGLSFAL